MIQYSYIIIYNYKHVPQVEETNMGCRMRSSDAISILNCAFDSSCVFTHGVW